MSLQGKTVSAITNWKTHKHTHTHTHFRPTPHHGSLPGLEKAFMVERVPWLTPVFFTWTHQGDGSCFEMLFQACIRVIFFNKIWMFMDMVSTWRRSESLCVGHGQWPMTKSIWERNNLFSHLHLSFGFNFAYECTQLRFESNSIISTWVQYRSYSNGLTTTVCETWVGFKQ